MEADFTGWATKAGLKCADGRTIMPEAFKHQDGVKVPLVWHHLSKDPKNILGYAILKHEVGGVRTEAYFNDTDNAKLVKMLIQHGDVDRLSIFANKLVERAKEVYHGFIREVSIVPSGANPGAIIDNIKLTHDDSGYEEILEDEAVIYTDLPVELSHAEDSDDKKDDDTTIGDIYHALSEEQKAVVDYLVGRALQADSSAEHSDESSEDDEDADETPTDEDTLDHQEGIQHMNVFEKEKKDAPEANSLTHSQVGTIFADAEKMGSLKESILAHAAEYGIEDIDFLFPDAKNITTHPTFIKRRTEWVSTVLDGTNHSPFSRIKMLHADITEEEARAKGYIKGSLKKAEVFKLLRRKIEPTTIYKKQHLDRDDMLDITDFDVVVWVKGEMRIMFDEEVAGAILVGDGRDVSDPDAIDKERLIPIAEEDELYAPAVYVETAAVTEFVDGVTSALVDYEGSGSPTGYIEQKTLTKMTLQRNAFGERVYKTPADLAAEMGVSKLVPIPNEIFARAEEYLGPDDEYEAAPGKLRMIVVNLRDYTVGADKGARLGMFDDFDIDYNLHKWLMETRISGALTKTKSAIRFYTAEDIEFNPVNPLIVNLAPAEEEEG